MMDFQNEMEQHCTFAAATTNTATIPASIIDSPEELSSDQYTDDDINEDYFNRRSKIRRTKTVESDPYAYKSKSWMALSQSISTETQSHSRSRSICELQLEKRLLGLQFPSVKPMTLTHPHMYGRHHKSIRHRTLSMAIDPSPSVDLGTCLAPLLTPPPDDVDDAVIDSEIGHTFTGTSNSNTQASNQQLDQHTVSATTTFSHPTGLDLSASQGQTAHDLIQHQTWIKRSSQIIVSLLINTTAPQSQVQMVSQTLPSQATESRLKPTFEDVLESVQLDMPEVPFVTITHAVTQARAMDELPKTPPSTPRPGRHDADDYFGEDQTIFTHGAVVPIYHNYGPVNTTSVRNPRQIVAPGCVQVSILERYIPPTLPEEINDFFNVSKRSYLVDRLAELAVDNGSLLLMYPTKKGGTTFAQKYIGPVLDPFLRQFIMLNNLTSDAASRMGTMTAIDAMIDYDEMRIAVQNLCRELTDRPPSRVAPSQYVVTHSEKTSLVLDHSTWTNWFVEQEQARLRQNLVDYHQAGGRMPGFRGHKEVTVGMLAREVVEGVKKSANHINNAGIEIGVFIITRSQL